jgi:hypothetical protein
LQFGDPITNQAPSLSRRSWKLDASAALAESPDVSGENVNYALKSSLLLNFLESVPDVEAKLKAPNMSDEKFSDVV